MWRDVQIEVERLFIQIHCDVVVSYCEDDVHVVDVVTLIGEFPGESMKIVHCAFKLVPSHIIVVVVVVVDDVAVR